MRALSRSLCALLAAVMLPAQAAVYRCVDAQGKQSISDKPCAAAQTTQKVYATPQAVPPKAEATAPGDASALMPQTPEELDALLNARANAAQRQKLEAEAAEQRRRDEPRRQMESFLQQREQQRSQWRTERGNNVVSEPGPASAGADNTAVCDSLRRQKAQLADAMRSGYGASAGNDLNEWQRRVDAALYSRGCTF